MTKKILVSISIFAAFSLAVFGFSYAKGQEIQDLGKGVIIQNVEKFYNGTSEEALGGRFIRTIRYFAPGIDMEGGKIDLDDDNDTSITVDTDDQVDFEIAGNDLHKWTASSTVFNETSHDSDFRVEGAGEANLFRTDALNDRVGVATSTPDSLFTVYSSATTTAEFGSSSGSQGTCFIVKTAAGALAYARFTTSGITVNQTSCTQ